MQLSLHIQELYIDYRIYRAKFNELCTYMQYMYSILYRFRQLLGRVGGTLNPDLLTNALDD